MKLKHMKVLQEIQAICEGEVKGGCSESCPFRYDGGHCLFMLIPKYWELDKFKIDERYNMEQLETIVGFYGVERQKVKAIEEMWELIKAICKNDIENIKEEIADVFIMLSQLQIMYGFSEKEIEKIQNEKINRTFDRIRDMKKDFLVI